MAVVTICSDFGAQKNKVWHCFHCFPIYFPWSDGTRSSFSECWVLSQLFHTPLSPSPLISVSMSSSGSLLRLHFLVWFFHKKFIHPDICRLQPMNHVGEAPISICKVSTTVQLTRSKCCLHHFQIENMGCPEFSSRKVHGLAGLVPPSNCWQSH